MNADSVTITDNSNCQRFYDLFDLSSINYETIDYFELTLSFQDTDDSRSILFGLIKIIEQWAARPASSASIGATSQSNISRKDGLFTQTLTFDSSNTNVFSDIVDNKSFYLWFSERSGDKQSFELADAKLDVFGTLAEVPEPAPLALLSLSLIALALSKRRKN